jgi:EmrB/QacA subfamily drug resistance transporter
MLCAANFMIILDGTIVFVAMPSIERSLHVSSGTAQWVMTAYGLVFAGLLLLCARAGDQFGRRRMFMLGSVVFALSSLMCGLAWAPWVLIAARAVQGLSAAIMSPAALSIVMTTFGEGSERNKALAVWGAVGGLGGTTAALIGGPLTDGLGWGWIFFINVPVGAVLLILSPLLLDERRERLSGRNYDVAGAVTATGGLVLIVYAIVRAPVVGWSNPWTVGPLAAAAVLLAAFVVIESRSAAPLMPLRIFRSRVLVGGNLTLFTIGMCAYGVVFTLTGYAQQVLHYSAVQFGLMTAVMAATAALSSFVAEAMANRRGPHVVAVASLVFVIVGCLLLTGVSPHGTYLGDIFWGLLIFGPGLGAGFVAGTIASFSGVEARDAGMASGLINIAWQMGGSLGIAIMTSVAVARSQAVAVSTGQAATAAVPLTAGFRSAFTAATVIGVLGFVAALVLIRRKRQVRPVEVDTAAAVAGN